MIDYDSHIQYILKRLSAFPEGNISLMNGSSGQALLNFYAGKVLKDEKLINKSREIIENIINAINEGNFNLSNVSTYCNGLTGIFYTIAILKENGVFEISDDELIDVEEFLYKEGHKAFAANNPDFLHGGMGILHYFLKGAPKDEKAAYINSLVDAYISAGVSDANGFRTLNAALAEREKAEYDLSLAHGLSGHIVILCSIINKLPALSIKVKPIILAALAYIENLEKLPVSTDNKFDTYFPMSNVEDANWADFNSDSYNSRLAWCYGELNYATMYFRLAATLENDNYKEKAITIAINTTKRHKLDNVGTHSPFFCHGAGGLVCIYDHFYKESGNAAFLEAKNYWADYTLKIYKDSLNMLPDNIFYNMLEGAGGLVLALLCIKENTMRDWNELFLLS